MKRLIDILKELDNQYRFSNKYHLFPTGAGEAAMIGIVLSAGDGLNPKEADKIIDLIKKVDKSADLKYFPATKKIVGRVAVKGTFDGANMNVRRNPTMDKIKPQIKSNLLKIRKDLDIKKKVTSK